ncbi:hypothetical protein [Candidatus Nitrosocosmicus sp. SS]|jgi:hypothetical protein|uniref:hypothetical protein n=1 Tax=Candidatus Nitrosocosmicus agrestis TaxID=2563600 RepID=UPI00122EA0C5|nr:hypothetical protein [Candidatus Nitrosocosmicus sp. SS]KAA2282915.1 hypothetical protein F1Z66_04405 [Candidatus Nitrosocosmicus sp. SS]KAF0869117.1 hypothetical protein E5N71_06685 [Candidatus Nitrosocosmicus sp. SS]MDR4489533.1 signal recognition particle subunit SRP68 [Candidatus Nitrosocosmicus sp.]
MIKSSTNYNRDFEEDDLIIQRIESIVLSSLYGAYKIGLPRLTFNDLIEIIFSKLGNDITLDVQRTNKMASNAISSLTKRDYIMSPNNGKDFRITLSGIDELEKEDYKNLA